MISKLINMNVLPIYTKSNNRIIPEKSGTFTIEEYAKAFINGMDTNQRNRFKRMLDNGIRCGMSVAHNYNIDYDKFIAEVKKQLEMEDVNYGIRLLSD